MRVELIGISKGYRSGWLGRRRPVVFEGLDLTVEPGQCIGVVGESGAGKTTLGRIMAAMIRPDSGRVLCDGNDLWSLSTKKRMALGRKIQILFQHPEAVFDPRWTMHKSLLEPFILNGRTPSRGTLQSMLAEVELDPSVLPRRAFQLSGGELQRVAIARVFALDPGVVVLDEPTSMLDPLTQAKMMHLLQRIQVRSEVGYVLISHNSALARRFCDLVFRLDRGRLVEEEV